jgi:hypothetical protein
MAGFALACAVESEPKPALPGSGSRVTAGGGASAADDDDDDGDPTAPDDPTGEPTQSCDPWSDPFEECGAGQACSFVDMRCHEALGTAGEDEFCELLDPDRWVGTCAPGLVCVVETESFGRCALPCMDDDVCGEGRGCHQPAGDSPTRVCVSPCDPIVQDCSTDEGCYVLDLDDPVPLCARAGPGVESDPCAVPDDCAPGHHCTAPANHMVECADPLGCCTPLCDVEIGDCVGLNPICTALAVPDAPNLGVCVGDV